MDLRELKLFLHLATSCHFSQTAKACYVSPSTLSRQIQRLEEELGYTLFIRDNRSVKLTEAGKQFKLFAQQTIQHYHQLQERLGQRGSHLSGELHLFCSVTAAYSHLPTILDNFRANYPAVEIKLSTGDAADAVEKIVSFSTDLAIAGRPELLPDSIDFFKIDTIPFSFIVPDIPCTWQQELIQAYPNWSKIPFILPEHGSSRRRAEQWFIQHNITHPIIYATVAGHEAIVSMVALGCGVALIPTVVLSNSPANILARIQTLNQYADIKPLDLGLCVQKKRLNEPLIAAFWQQIKTI